MRRDCSVCRAEGLEALTRMAVWLHGRHILATLNVVDSDLLAANEASRSTSAVQRCGLVNCGAVAKTVSKPLRTLAIMALI